MNMDALKARLKADEGLRLKPYGDLKSKITIGYGRNLTDVGISSDEAEAMLDEDIDRTMAMLCVNWQPFTGLDDVRQQVICNMAFNLGIVGLLKFTQTLAAISAGDYAQAAVGMRRSLWARQVGLRAERLAIAMETGAFPV